MRSIVYTSTQTHPLTDTELAEILAIGRERNTQASEDNIAHNVATVGVLEQIASVRGVTTSQLALAWLIAQDTVPIPGTKRRRWLESNAAAANIALTDEELTAIEQASPAGVTAGARNTPQGLASTGR